MSGFNPRSTRALDRAPGKYFHAPCAPLPTARWPHRIETALLGGMNRRRSVVCPIEAGVFKLFGGFEINTRAARETELRAKLCVVSVLMFGGRYLNIDRWAMTACRYEGAKAE
jgi:hypothetical protein